MPVSIQYCTAQTKAPPQRFVVNNTEHVIEELKNVLIRCGGTLNPRLVAITWNEAEKFPDLISKKGRPVKYANLKSCRMESKRTRNRSRARKRNRRTRNRRNKRLEKRSIGRVKVINCYPSGSISSTNTARLCNECSAVIDLGEEYFPRYVNEIICDTLCDSCPSCFGGEGVCKTKEQSFSFLRNIGNSIYEAVSINFGACCECGLYQDSPLTGFL